KQEIAASFCISGHPMLPARCGKPSRGLVEGHGENRQVSIFRHDRSRLAGAGPGQLREFFPEKPVSCLWSLAGTIVADSDKRPDKDRAEFFTPRRAWKALQTQWSRAEGGAEGFPLEQITKTSHEGRSHMKQFLAILAASIFLVSAVSALYAAQEDRKVGFVGEQKTPGENTNSNIKSGAVSESRGEKEDRKVGFVGEQKSGHKKTPSNVKSGPVPESREAKEDRKVGFVGEQKTK